MRRIPIDRLSIAKRAGIMLAMLREGKNVRISGAIPHTHT
jgi:hypothetical protein